MIILKGTGISEGIAFGKLFINTSQEWNFEKKESENSEIEIERYEKAEKQALEYTKLLYEKVLSSLGKDEAEIFKSHEAMIKDKDFKDSIIKAISSEKTSAEYAVWKTSKKFEKFFLDMPDPYMKGRAVDIIDISKCIINILMGKNNAFELENKSGNIILAATDFTPSEISSVDKNKVQGFLCADGSTYSHTSILLRVMKIPGVVCLKDQLSEEYNGKYVVFDGSSGEVYIDPEDMILKLFKNKKIEQEKSKKLLKTLKGKENITLDGKEIKVYANMNNPGEIDEIIENDSGGIGLLRSEFIYLGKKDFPSEDYQFEIYKDILQKMNQKEVIIRTIDIGSDKKTDYFNLPFEHNPAMGYRGIRVCLDNPEVFKTQLKAIYRASVYGNVSIMFPMISSVSEVMKIKKYLKEVEKELSENSIPFNKNIKKGIMIETPAAVAISDELAREVDFFSIGTNDLTQYTLAVDRQNSKVNTMFDTHHKAIIRMIKFVADNAHKNNIKVGICGESASDESLLETYLAIGIDELSMSAPFILKIREKIINTNISEIKENILKKI